MPKAGDCLMGAGKGGDFGNTKGSKQPKFPGNDPSKSPGENFEWRGKSTPQEGKGNWYNPKTGEKWNSDLNQGDPIGSHWDYTNSGGQSFRIYEDGRVVPK